ncbi:MAG: alpha/beta hydrolase [Myxococcaceae bacterium]
MPDGGSRFFHQSFFTTDDGAPLWFEERGDGPGIPAVLNDGLGCDGFIWRYLWEPLTAHRRVMHWNYRGHGKSGVPTDSTRIGVEYTCDDMARLMDHTKIDRGVIFGHSMGVQVALEFHRRYPQRVAGLVLLCGSYGTPLDTWHDHSLMRIAFPRLRAMVEKFPDVAKLITSKLLRTELAVEFGIRTELNPILLNHNDFHPYMEHLAKMHPLYFVRTLDSLKDHSALDHLPEVKVPTLVVGGEIDKFTPVWLSQRMAEHLPQAKYLFVPGGSHTAPLERPGLVNDEIEQFLQTLK